VCASSSWFVWACAGAGLAGFYITDDSKATGGCGGPWNLDYVEQRHLMLADKVLDNKCQLSFEKEGAHRNDLYGDINTVCVPPLRSICGLHHWYMNRIAAVRVVHCLQWAQWVCLLAVIGSLHREPLNASLLNHIHSSSQSARRPLVHVSAYLMCYQKQHVSAWLVANDGLPAAHAQPAVPKWHAQLAYLPQNVATCSNTLSCAEVITTESCNDIPSGIVRRSGIPWPVMRLEAKWYRFRIVNAGPSRAYMLKIKNERGEDVQQQACYVIATDEGEKGGARWR
jgi:FtsP/CotA-like multicopper oxidase with cupredoxin domain